MAKLSTILDQVEAGSMLLPEFQRGYVWNRDQVRGLMRSLYRGYPVGGLLVWETESSAQAIRGVASASGQRQLLLDGQQRVTTLYGVIRGEAPSFFEGDPRVLTGLRFNVETEVFEFHAPIKMRGDPLWLDVTAVFAGEDGAVLDPLLDLNWVRPKLSLYLNRISRLRSILQREFHVEQITGADKTIDVVVDIFNRVNHGGTKLSKGDLALARICSEWSDARPTMRRNVDRWRESGFSFTPDWLLRNVNAVSTGKAPFAELEDVPATDFQHALHETLDHVDHFLRELAVARLGLDHDRVLFGRYAIPVISRHLHNSGGRFADGAEADRALYWYVHAALRGRFAGSTETFLAKDLATVDKDGVDGLVKALARTRKGRLSVDPQDFEGLGRGSRAYPLLYLLARVEKARDLVTGRVLGRDSSTLQVHEVFPRKALVRAGYTRGEVNDVANLTFLSPSSAVQLTGLDPADYLADLDADALASQWVPTDPGVWRVESYRRFLAARRRLLATAATTVLDGLHAGTRPWEVLEPLTVGPEAPDIRVMQIRSLATELDDLGFASPALDTEIADPETGRVLAVAEAFWPDGFQPGQGRPVVLELDPDDADVPRLTELGLDVFTSVDALRGYALRLVAVEGGEQSSGTGAAALTDGAAFVERIEDGAFDVALLTAMERSRVEVGHDPSALRLMSHRLGALGAARALLATATISDGFVALWERDRLDLTVESLVLDDAFAHLFTQEQQDTARRRLDAVTFGLVGVTG